MQIARIILLAAGNAILVLLLTPLFEGVLRKITAKIQSRQGPPIRQAYFDLLKLLGKEDLESGENPPLQRFAAYLAFAVTLSLAAFVPMGWQAPMQSAGDGITLIYILTLCAICTLLAGLAAGSTYSLIGTSREVMSLITLEPLFAAAILVGAIQAGSLNLDRIFAGSVFAPAGFPIAGFLMLLLLLLGFQAFAQRVPFDIPGAETEIMEGALMEYSGPKLAFLRFAHMARLTIYSAMFVGLFFPWGSDLPFPLSAIVFWAKVAVFILLSTLLAATHARYRIDQAVRFYAVLLGLSFVGLVLASYGH